MGPPRRQRSRTRSRALVETALEKPRRLSLDELTADRAGRLTAYQNAAYARDYTDFVNRVSEAGRATPNDG